MSAGMFHRPHGRCEHGADAAFCSACVPPVNRPPVCGANLATVPQGGVLQAALEGQRVLRARVAELEAEIASHTPLWHGDNCPRLHDECVAAVTELRARVADLVAQLVPSVDEQERLARQANAEERACRLADTCGELASLNDQLMLTNARLRRRLGE